MAQSAGDDLFLTVVEIKDKLQQEIKKYKLKKLIYLEEYSNVNEAIAREKQLKNWHREWKLNLIKKVNPKFNDLSIF